MSAIVRSSRPAGEADKPSKIGTKIDALWSRLGAFYRESTHVTAATKPTVAKAAAISSQISTASMLFPQPLDIQSIGRRYVPRHRVVFVGDALDEATLARPPEASLSRRPQARWADPVVQMGRGIGLTCFHEQIILLGPRWKK
jgi:hypothetical protein